jgi:hypothetical protein
VEKKPGSSVGRLGWARGTGGQLRTRDRVRLLRQGVLAQLFDLPLPVGGRLGQRSLRPAVFDLDDLRVPDSGACREAEERCEQMKPDFLVNHSYRTYIWAVIRAAHEGLRYDEEVVYVSSLLHDLGLAEQETTSPTFTLVGARAAPQCGAAGSWKEDQELAAAEAITIHMNLRVRPTEGVESYLVTAGTQMDAVGARYWTIDPSTRAAVVSRYPRDGAKEGFVRLFSAQANAHPGSRAHFYCRYLALRRRFRVAPFDQ